MKALILWTLAFAAFAAGLGAYSTIFPGTNKAGITSTPESRELAEKLREHVEALAQEIGSRDNPARVQAAGDYLERQLDRAGYDVVTEGTGPKTLVVERTGTKHAREVVIVCAHYDSPSRSPGADANASGCAALIEIARAAASTGNERTLRFVLFPDGCARGVPDADRAAARYARACQQRGEAIAAVLELDCVGTYDAKGRQDHPFPLGLVYPGRADFVAVVGSFASRDVVSRTVELMRSHAGMGVEGLVVAEFTPGLGASAAAAFWDAGWPAAIVTDTGTYRSARVGTASDTHDRLDYDGLARVTLGLQRTVGMLCRRATLAL